MTNTPLPDGASAADFNEISGAFNKKKVVLLCL